MAPRRLAERSSRVVLENDADTIVAVADTHSRPHPAIHRWLEEIRPAAILHAGDIGDLAVLEELARHAPVHAVRGNIDTTADDLADVRIVDVVRPGGELRILMTHIAIAGTRLRADVARQARAAGAPLVVCGHSHIPFIGGERGVTVFNPGSIGPRRFALPIVFGVIELGAGRLRLGHRDCESGAAWSPPG